MLKDVVKDAQPEVRANFERARKVFETLGTIEEVERPDGPFEAATVTILDAESASAFEELVDSGDIAELTAPEDRIGGYGCQVVLATEYLRALRIRAKLARALDAFLAPFDAVLGVPTHGAAPTATGPFGDRFDGPSLSGPGNLCGTPALVLPTGLTDDGLPTALQLDGQAYSENRLLALGVAFQQATGWHEQRPQVVEESN